MWGAAIGDTAGSRFKTRVPRRYSDDCPAGLSRGGVRRRRASPLTLIRRRGSALPSSARASSTLHRRAARVVHRPHPVEQPLPVGAKDPRAFRVAVRPIAIPVVVNKLPVARAVVGIGMNACGVVKIRSCRGDSAKSPSWTAATGGDSSIPSADATPLPDESTARPNPYAACGSAPPHSRESSIGTRS